MLGLPPVQQKIKELVLQEIMKKTQNKISIGDLRFRPFNHLQLKEIYATDLNNDTLLYAEKLNASFNLFKFLHKRFIIHSIEIDQLDLHISKDSVNAPFNFQFLIDAFASDTTQTADSTSLQLAIDHILLKNGRLRYDVFSEPFQPPGIFDFNHVDISNLQLDSKLRMDSSEDWSAAIENLSLNEKSGFNLKQMSFQVANLKNQLKVSNFYISLPHSEGKILEADFDYTGLALNDILSGASYSVRIPTGKWDLRDFSCFYPELVNYPEMAACSIEMEGKFPEVSLPLIELNYGDQFYFKGKAKIADYNAWETSDFNLDIGKCSLDPKLFELPLPTDLISLTGKINGSLPDLNAALTAKSENLGELTLNGTGGYYASSGNIRFDLEMESPTCDVKSLLSDSTFGEASFRFAAQGTITGQNKIQAKADAEIHRFDYLGYTYQDITADATYANDSVSVDLSSKDAHLPVIFHGKAGLNKNNSFVQLYANLRDVHPYSLHLLPQYPGSEFSGSIRADIRGFDPERMTASVVIENLHLTTPTGDFSDSPITFSYHADADNQKQISLQSATLNVRGQGNFTYEGIIQSLKQAFPALFPLANNQSKIAILNQENFDYRVAIRRANAVARLLEMETTIPDSALIVGKYNRDGENMNLNTTAFCRFNQTDTVRVKLNLSNVQNNLAVQLDLRNRSNQYALEGNLGATIEFIRNAKKAIPDMKIALDPGAFTLNGTDFQINPAQIAITNDKYEIDNFALKHSISEYLKIDGVVSDNVNDSIQVSINKFEIGTFLSALKNKVPLSGTASGDITFSRLMTNPLILTRNLSINNLAFDGNSIGDLQLRSAWSSERQGLALRATWNPPNAGESVVSGFYLMKTDSIALTADIRGIQLKWLEGYLPSTISGLDGELGAQIKASGNLNDPVLSGKLLLNEASFGIPMLNTRYRISDSILLGNNQISFQNFVVHDEDNGEIKINGNISHKQFSSLNPKLTLDFNQFLVLNNSEQTDSLFYGLVRLAGNLNISVQNKDWLIQGTLSNGRANKVMMNLPESAIEAERYNWLTFVSTQKNDSTTTIKEQPSSELTELSFPIKLKITLSVNQNLSVGAVINPDTKDAAVVTGRGILDFSYNFDNPVPYLLGTYVINDGKCTLSLKNITKKTFSVQPGGKLNFQGDLMSTTFDLSALYSLRTYLTSLDPSFASLINASKIPVNCVLSANGKFEDMQLQYRIELPDQPDEIQRKLDGLIYSDEIKIKEIAYLLAFGSFMPINSSSSSSDASLWTSLASSSITNQLNHLLSGVLSDNWTIGTDLHSKDSNFSDVDMDINISTRMFNDRLTINSTLGYHNSTDQINNFTGDFNIEYKLTPSGNLLLQFYNVTNNQYYDKSRSPLTQGAGVVYKREGRTFRQLFRNLRRRGR